ncbi:MAG: precorrin-8X methylmutase [Clostridiales bacterium]|nr:precorrin-8X methylmutase [Clostridiales bacterium]
MNTEYIKPMDIEKRSMEIIAEHLGDAVIDAENRDVLMRVIHTTADFDYVENLKFSAGAVSAGIDALKSGAHIVTDTNMAFAGINKKLVKQLGGDVHCFMADAEVAEKAKAQGITRAAVAVEKACELKNELIFAVGNAPTALIKLDEMIKQHKVKPKLIIGVPVGFVNVVEAKEIIMQSGIPYIVAKGNKGGSNVAAAICNALLYKIRR